jgi:hypothetical protein
MSRKKVIVRRWNLDWIPGYLPLSGFVHEDAIRVLCLDGKVTPVLLPDVKWACFVRDFNSGEKESPERLMRKTFSHRPRTRGLWLRVRLKDNDTIEGIAQNDVTLIDTHGLFLIPPDSRSNTQLIFLPRLAITELEIQAVVRPGAPRKSPEAVQESLFIQQNHKNS